MGVIEQFVERRKELELGDTIIRANKHTSRRRKRSPFDFVGFIASEAFGVLDQRYAREYAKELEKLKNNDQHLTTLLNHNEERVKPHFGALERNIKTIKNTYDEAELSISEQKRSTNLINIIIDSNHGKLNPILFPAEQVEQQISLIKNHLTADLSIPIEHGITEFYSTMKVRTRTIGPTVLFEIKVPLQNSMNFQLYRVQPIPIPQNNEFIFIKPSCDFLIINLQRDLYYPLREIEFLRCSKRNENYFACQQKHPLFKPASQKCTCEVNLLKHQGMRNCTVKRQASNGLWSEITSSNKWLFAVNQTTTIDVICNNELYPIKLIGSGIIEFNDRCLIERNDFVIHTFKTITTHFNGSFTPAFNLTSVLRDGSSKIQLEQFQLEDNLELKNLDEEIKNLRKDVEEPIITTHDIHHYTAIYLLLFLSVITFIIYKRNHIILRIHRSKVISEAPECLSNNNQT